MKKIPQPHCPWTIAQIAACLTITGAEAALLYAELEVATPKEGALIMRDALTAKGIPCNRGKLALAWRGGIPLPTALALMAEAAERGAIERARGGAAPQKTVSIFFRRDSGPWLLHRHYKGGASWRSVVEDAKGCARREIAGTAQVMVVTGGRDNWKEGDGGGYGPFGVGDG